MTRLRVLAALVLAAAVVYAARRPSPCPCQDAPAAGLHSDGAAAPRRP